MPAKYKWRLFRAGQRLKEFRKSLGLSQTKFGRPLRWDHSMTSRAERGLREWTPEDFEAMKKAYGEAITYEISLILQGETQLAQLVQNAAPLSNEEMESVNNYINRLLSKRRKTKDSR